MKEKFSFDSPGKIEYGTLTYTGFYVNKEATNQLLKGGGYVKVLFDKENQAIQLESKNKPGVMRFLLSDGSLGTHLRLREKSAALGMLFGKYLYIGKGVFQHIDYV